MRNIIQVIDKIKACVPVEQKEIIEEPERHRYDFSYKAPEQMTGCWQILVRFLDGALGEANTEWKKQIALIMTDKEGDVKKKRFKLSPELVDGDNWTVVDTKRDVLQYIEIWFDDCDPEVGDSFQVEVIEMSDKEVEAMPEL